MNRYVVNSGSLITSKEARSSGFSEIALRKGKEASHYLDLANALKIAIQDYENPLDLIDKKELLTSICDAAGISTKARNYLTQDNIREILIDFFEQFILVNKQNYVDQLVNRYLLTQGDALGGRIRNIVGRLAAEKFTKHIIATLKIYSYKFQCFNKKTKKWIKDKDYTEEILQDIKSIKWLANDKRRTLVYDLTVPIVKKNVDLVIFSSFFEDFPNKSKFIQDPNHYLALGELKGGIDPAGADEHWKTANTSLERIRQSFADQNIQIKTFFVGAAIEKAMAEEIYSHYSDGRLKNCANLTNTDQFNELCNWIIHL